MFPSRLTIEKPHRRLIGKIAKRDYVDRLMNAKRRQAKEIGERIRELRENSSHTNRSIADHCGVDVRTVAGWIAGKGLKYENAEAVAELFDVDVNWLWRGQESTETPDITARLQRIEEHTAKALAKLERLEAAEDEERERRRRAGGE